ncbi:MAG: phytanoyl-CoA dioxygenase family protein [Cypionkella sp.]|uniref:phytanoyl-CoA dioxygenase family protein n=1 Tax=Cypionkella sp. TaxID=2811411 RepID=UPI002ABA2297|nr:phytanoyl-CoA dioxygenase family protein [Cypionkella sp.]MDZ4309018.1 phytanoyl-CoA dioxygenase family protein [Cypionkella sp.]
MTAPKDFAATGRLWLRKALTEAELAPYDTIANRNHGPGARVDLGSDFGIDAQLTRAITALFPDFRAVRAVVFNKTEANNWGVPWHQDRLIPVAARHEVEGFHNWSQKTGIWHCEPPLAFLNQMLFVRLHLDPTDADSGPMEIALGSHHAGLITSAACDATAASHQTELCTAQRGDLLILHMLTLHRSRPAIQPSARRTLRIDFAKAALPTPLEWAA